MNSHADIQKRLAAYCNRELDAGEQARIEAHLAACPHCRADLADLKTTLKLVRSTPLVEPPPWMTSRIMAHLREEKGAQRSWFQRICFPQQSGFTVKILALLVVCISGYYLSHTVETEIKQAAQQQLQEMPGQQAPLPIQAPVEMPAKREKQEQPAVVQPQPVAPAAAPQPAPRREPLPAQTAPQLPAAAPERGYAPPPPAAYKEQYGGKAEVMKAAPAPQSSDRANEATPEKKMKSRRSIESSSDAAAPAPAPAPAAAGRMNGAAVDLSLPQATLRLSVDDPLSAGERIREAVFRSGGSISNDQGQSLHRLTARIPAARQGELLERLQRLGRISERPTPPPAGIQLQEIAIQW